MLPAPVSPDQILLFGSLILLSFADLRFRTLPGVWIIFFAALGFAIQTDFWKALLVLGAVGWGSAAWLPVWFGLPTVFYPPLWPLLLTSAGVRRNLVAKGDLLGLGAVALLTNWYGPLLALLGVWIWRRFWLNWRPRAAPALPGMALGVFVSAGLEIFS